MLFVENDPALLDDADRQGIVELVELARVEPGDVLEPAKFSGVRCSHGAHLRNVSDGLPSVRKMVAPKGLFDGLRSPGDRSPVGARSIRESGGYRISRFA